MVEVKSFRIKLIMRTSKTNGVKFPTYKVAKADGTWCTAKFTREAIANATKKQLAIPSTSDSPKEFIVTCRRENVNLSRADYETLWIKEIEDITYIQNTDEIDELFS